MRGAAVLCALEAARTHMHRWMPATIALTIVFGLVIDQYGGAWGQSVVNVWVALLFSALVFLSEPSERPALWWCLAIATLGEIFCSLIWGIYEYRLGGVPLFVPPGHVLLFWLGVHVARTIPDMWLKAALGSCTVAILVLGLSGQDSLSPLLLLVFFACWRWGPAPRLYATMFLLALLMEVLGTYLGNWTWRQTVPYFGWPTMNPPLAAGACYCVLDLLVQVIARNRPALTAGALKR